MSDISQSFSTTYDEARDKFLLAATALNGQIASYAHPEQGPAGENLSTDVAWFGPREASRVLVLISGTHGVEGFCGSGAQIDWLTRGEADRLPEATAALLIHAINPYGFAWLRRVTHENVDLNRNWIDFSSPLPENAAYDQLAEAICPGEWTEASIATTSAVLAGFGKERGFGALQQALTGGQYSHRDGIYFGGDGPTWSRRTQAAIFSEHLGRAERVAILDYHTGLGPWGYAEQIVVEPPTAPAFRRARRWYGAAVATPLDGTSSSSPLLGDGLSAAPGLLPHAEVTAVALEVGTKSPAEVLGALRADAWLHVYGDLASEQGRQIKQQIRSAFYGDTEAWKGMVAGQSLLACRQAVAGLKLD